MRTFLCAVSSESKIDKDDVSRGSVQRRPNAKQKGGGHFKGEQVKKSKMRLYSDTEKGK